MEKTCEHCFWESDLLCERKGIIKSKDDTCRHWKEKEGYFERGKENRHGE